MLITFNYKITYNNTITAYIYWLYFKTKVDPVQINKYIHNKKVQMSQITNSETIVVYWLYICTHSKCGYGRVGKKKRGKKRNEFNACMLQHLWLAFLCITRI